MIQVLVSVLVFATFVLTDVVGCRRNKESWLEKEATRIKKITQSGFTLFIHITLGFAIVWFTYRVLDWKGFALGYALGWAWEVIVGVVCKKVYDARLLNTEHKEVK